MSLTPIIELRKPTEYEAKARCNTCSDAEVYATLELGVKRGTVFQSTTTTRLCWRCTTQLRGVVLHTRLGKRPATDQQAPASTSNG